MINYGGRKTSELRNSMIDPARFRLNVDMVTSQLCRVSIRKRKQEMLVQCKRCHMQSITIIIIIIHDIFKWEIIQLDTFPKVSGKILTPSTNRLKLNQLRLHIIIQRIQTIPPAYSYFRHPFSQHKLGDRNWLKIFWLADIHYHYHYHQHHTLHTVRVCVWKRVSTRPCLCGDTPS